VTIAKPVSDQPVDGRVVSEDPYCREVNLPSLDTWITPTRQFFVRSHFHETPHIDTSTHRLVIEGSVDRKISFSHADILAMPSREMTVTIECAGNSRSYMMPPAEGLKFTHGAISTAVWKGVPLSLLLERAGIRRDAKEVLFEGADGGEEEEDGKKVHINYERSLTIAQAVDPEVIVATHMNGELLNADHGAPLRLVVPGWFGMASVKWLTRISLIDYEFKGFFQKRRYLLINEGAADEVTGEPVSRMKVKALIAQPKHGEIVRPGGYTIRGFAWSGEADIAKVEVSTDAGKSWHAATLLTEKAKRAWRRWEYRWVSHPGHFVLKVRATDSNGVVQPEVTAWNFRGYVNSAIHSVAVKVPLE